MMFKNGLTHQTMVKMMIALFQEEWTRKNWFSKEELGRKIMMEFVALRPKIYSYLMDDDSEHKKTKGTKKCVIRLKFDNYKDCLLNNKIISKSPQRFKSEKHNLYIDEINKISLIGNNDKDYKLLIKLQYIHMEQMLLKYAKAKCYININD